MHQLIDQVGIIGSNGDFHAGWQLGNDLLIQARIDSIDNGHRVGACDLDDAQSNAWLIVETGQPPIVCQSVFHLCDIAETYGCPLAVGDDHLLQLSGLMEFQVELNQVFTGLADQEAAGHLEVFTLKGTNQVLCSMSRLTRMVRSRLPPMRTSPTPSMFSRRFLITMRAY